MWRRIGHVYFAPVLLSIKPKRVWVSRILLFYCLTRWEEHRQQHCQHEFMLHHSTAPTGGYIIDSNVLTWACFLLQFLCNSHRRFWCVDCCSSLAPINHVPPTAPTWAWGRLLSTHGQLHTKCAAPVPIIRFLRIAAIPEIMLPVIQLPWYISFIARTYDIELFEGVFLLSRFLIDGF